MLFVSKGLESKTWWMHDDGVRPHSGYFGVLHRQENICCLTSRQMAPQTIHFPRQTRPTSTSRDTSTRSHEHTPVLI